MQISRTTCLRKILTTLDLDYEVVETFEFYIAFFSFPLNLMLMAYSRQNVVGHFYG